MNGGDADDDYMQKEREIKELNDLRIKTLERLVKEKVDIIHQQEAELAMSMQDFRSIKGTVHEKDKFLNDFERRLDISKNILQ